MTIGCSVGVNLASTLLLINEGRSRSRDQEIKRSRDGRGGKIRAWDGEKDEARRWAELGPDWGRIGMKLIINDD